MSETTEEVFIAPRRLRALAQYLPDRVPLTVAGASGWLSGLTYAEWNGRADEIAQGLLQRGVRVGDRVVLLFEGMAWAEYAAAYSAVHRVGATGVHLSPPLGGTEIRRRCAEVAPAGVLYGPGTESRAADIGTSAWVVRARDCAVAGGGAVDVDFGPEAVSDIFYTSGTTGPAKALCVSHGNLGFGRGLTRVAAEVFDGEAPIVAPMPLGTAPSAGMVAIFAGTTTSTIVVCADDAEEVAAAVAGSCAGSLMATPALVMDMLDRRVWERHDLGSLTSIGVASAQLPSRYGRTLAQLLPGAAVMVTYGGGSEAIPANIRGMYDPAAPGRIGRPSPGTRLRLVEPGSTGPRNASSPEVAAGAVGRVVLQHEAPRRRFLDPCHDAGVYEDGWIFTNDLARVDPADGTFHVFDRGEDAVPTADGPVSSLDAENLLYEHPDVLEAAVVAGPRRSVGYVVLAKGSTAAPHDVLAAAWSAVTVTGGVVPDIVERIDDIPRGPQGGKVLKRVLRERATGRA